jgi:hypothetical protein
MSLTALVHLWRAFDDYVGIKALKQSLAGAPA